MLSGEPTPASVACHDEEWRAVELVDRPQAPCVVVLRDVDDFLLRRHARDRNAVVKALVNAHETAELLLQYQGEREIAERHRYDRVECIRIARSNEIAEPLVDDVDPAAVVVPGRVLLERRSD